VIEAVAAAAEESNWPPGFLFADAARRLPPGNAGRVRARALAEVPAPAPSLLLDGGAEPVAVPPEAVAAVFAPGGPLEQAMGPEFERRAGQVEMAERVLRAFNGGDHLMVEAGTGTGKSLAYLLPAALWATANERRAVIATNTIALQEQLLHKDIPQVQALLAAQEHAPPRAAVLKGRANYLCTRRLQAWQAGRRLAPAELAALARVLVWLPQTETGDVSELALPTAADREVWAQICSDGATCSPERCGEFGSEETRDFFYLARRRAEAAHLLVVNHALLLADVAAEGRVLPPYSHLIVDEAHHLEDAATDQLTYRADWPAVQGWLRRLGGSGDLMQQVMRLAVQMRLPEAQAQAVLVGQRAGRAAQEIADFAEQITAFARQNEEIRSDAGYAQRLLLNGRVRSQPLWSRIEIEWDHATTPLTALLEAAQGLLHLLLDAGWDEQEPAASAVSELQGVIGALGEFAQRMDEIVLAPSGVEHSGQVQWLEVNDARSSAPAPAALATAPIHVGEVIERELLRPRRCTVFTGATLRTDATFRYIRERLGLWDVRTAIVDSPFDYQRCTLLYLPSDLVTPANAAWQSAVERAVVDAAEACNGRTLVLFTSYAQLRATGDAIRDTLERSGIAVLQHGMSSRQRLLRDFRAAGRAVLLGTRSFWEGIDLPGDELRCLVIVKLPFAVPNDPLVAARSRDCDDPFVDYMLPDAILRFRQGFGRLIRRASDRGVVVLLDSRVWRKEYGQAFLDALPACTQRRTPLANLRHEVRRWLGN
jgi:DNA polymerase-3 subunit epsilon/ATP-dependent DNA helicase DinG